MLGRLAGWCPGETAWVKVGAASSDSLSGASYVCVCVGFLFLQGNQQVVVFLFGVSL